MEVSMVRGVDVIGWRRDGDGDENKAKDAVLVAGCGCRGFFV